MEQAKSLLQSNPHPKWSTDASFDKVCAAISRSFAGSETTPAEPISSWVFRDILPKQGEPERVESYKFLMAFAIEDVFRHGGISFGHSDENGRLQSCAIIREFDPAIEFNGKHHWDGFVAGLMGFWIFIKAKIGGTLPSAFTDESAMKMLEEKGKQFDKDLKELHKLYGPKEKHFYVFNVATDPDLQGRGYGGQLMNQINEISDASGLPCYLECAGEKNRSFYEKFGFKTVKQHPLVDRKDNSQQFLVDFMVRATNV
eukprot:CAMPEP_0119013912 /NCGR_PEP_ID=MMETSP1176-20130426/9219_1 /TAXON_ID=265551 /ORGANISM="Synedropsis recta cf, Strain CCMP1620" /LENGTH=256 /DNA_ID=CAMNT_0006967039 /DNA_START=40 /DNA_END=810 /DNA_ORIENTATION=+